MTGKRKTNSGNPAAPRAPRVTITPDGGVFIVADDKGHPQPDPEPGRHEWFVLAGHRVDPVKMTQALDRRTLVTIEGPGCLRCGAAYDARTALARCPGEPPQQVEETEEPGEAAS